MNKRCRRCGEALETIPHVLNHTAARQLRHNAVQDRLVKAAARCPGHISVNNTVEGVHGQDAALRPDIVVRDDANRRITIVDVCVPFENRIAAIDAVRQDKIAKYQPLADQLSGMGYGVTVKAFTIGALRAWDHRNERVMRLLNISPHYAASMRRLMISDTVRWSRDIYVEHVSGERQYMV